MGTIVITAYGKKVYDRTLPDKVCFAIAKDREKRDQEFQKKLEEQKEDFQKAI